MRVVAGGSASTHAIVNGMLEAYASHQCRHRPNCWALAGPATIITPTVQEAHPSILYCRSLRSNKNGTTVQAKF